MLFSADIRISRIDAENRKFGSITTENTKSTKWQQLMYNHVGNVTGKQ